MDEKNRIELIFRDEEIDRLANKVASKINITNKESLYYGEIARFKNCSIHFDMDKQHRDRFLIKNNDGDIIGRFSEIIRCKACVHHRCSERNLWCVIFNKIMPEDGYCCFGEDSDGMY